jgi:protein TonB
MQGLLISKEPPIYPEEARTAHIQGTVWMAMEISREGSVCRIVLIGGHPVLAPAAIDAVKQWKYRPYLLNGQPVEVETQVQVNFTLKP